MRSNLVGALRFTHHYIQMMVLTRVLGLVACPQVYAVNFRKEGYVGRNNLEITTNKTVLMQLFLPLSAVPILSSKYLPGL